MRNEEKLAIVKETLLQLAEELKADPFWRPLGLRLEDRASRLSCVEDPLVLKLVPDGVWSSPQEVS